MEDELLDIIQSIERKKRDACVAPEHVMFIRDIQPAIFALTKKVLNDLVKAKKIIWVRTINDDAFKIAKNEKAAE